MEYKIQKYCISPAWVQPLDQQTILMVKKAPEYTEGIVSILEQDYQLVFAANGQEVLEFAQTKQPDLILLNIKLTDIDSYEICSRLRADARTYRIPVIFIADSENEVNPESIKAGAVDYIVRPVQPAILIARVRMYLELKRYRDLQDGQVITDSLTGMPNRHRLEKLLNREWRRAIRCQTPQSLIVIDIDFFNAYNNYYGHLAGDDCLRQIACVLIKNTKRETDCVARFGADEFANLLPETDASGAVQVAHQVQETVENLNIPHAGSPITDHVTLSFGVATMRPRPSLEPANLIQQADALLNQAKRDGYNQIRFGQD
jgi:diguanylate cyclase (GGDEF)-like protein